jgi:hypothetical protein
MRLKGKRRSSPAEGRGSAKGLRPGICRRGPGSALTVFLASEESGFVTGANFIVDGDDEEEDLS